MTDNQLLNITHVWPYSKHLNPDAQPFSEERETDIWDELRQLTFDEDVKGNIFVITHATVNINGVESFIKDRFEEDELASNRVEFFDVEERALFIHRPAQKAFTLRSNSASGSQANTIEIPAKTARDEKEVQKIAFNLGSKADASRLISACKAQQVTNSENKLVWIPPQVSALVIWKPDQDQLKHLPLVRSKCPDLPIYIFHLDFREDRWGVEREGRSGNWQSSFHTKAEALTVSENVEIVVRGLCNVGTVSMWGALPKHGKSYLFLSLMKALLSGKPWLDYFEVSQSKRVVYLVPEVGLRGVMKRLRKLGMVDYLYDPSSNPDGVLFLQTLSSRDKLKLDDAPLLQAVQGADVFVDPIIRYIEGEENNASDQRILSNKLLALISAEARSVWCAHHSPKAFKDVTAITTQNVLRGTGEFAAFPDIIFGVLKTNDETSRLYIKCTDARDDDEYLGDFEVEMRPWIDETGDLKLVVAPGTGTPLKEQTRNKKSGSKGDPEKQLKIEYASTVGGSFQEKADAVNKKFGSKHSRSTICDWLKGTEFDSEATL